MISEKKINKWKKVGILEGVPKEEEANLSQLLENQARSVLKRTKEGPDGVAIYPKYIDRLCGSISFPVVRRVWNHLTDQQKRQIMRLPADLVDDKACVAEDCKFSFSRNLFTEFDRSIHVCFSGIDYEIEITQILSDELGSHLAKQGNIALYVVINDVWGDKDQDDSIIVSRYARLKEEKND